MSNHKHPLQPLVRDEAGTVRFNKNRIIRYLCDRGIIDLNQLARLDFPAEDWEQLMQLLGYSVDGFSDLSCVSDETWERVEEEQQKFLAAE